MENDLSVFLSAVIHHPVGLATSFLLVAGTVYAVSQTAGLDSTTSLASGLIAGGFFAYANAVSAPRRVARDEENEVLNNRVLPNN